MNQCSGNYEVIVSACTRCKVTLKDIAAGTLWHLRSESLARWAGYHHTIGLHPRGAPAAHRLADLVAPASGLSDVAVPKMLLPWKSRHLHILLCL